MKIIPINKKDGIVIHDDSDGLLATYEISKSKEYFTIELNSEIK